MPYQVFLISVPGVDTDTLPWKAVILNLFGSVVRAANIRKRGLLALPLLTSVPLSLILTCIATEKIVLKSVPVSWLAIYC